MTPTSERLAAIRERANTPHAKAAVLDEGHTVYDGHDDYQCAAADRAVLLAMLSPENVAAARPTHLMNTDDEDAAAIFDFLDNAAAEMRKRMVEAATIRGWGASWQHESYDDPAAMKRAGRAYDHLTAALHAYRIADTDAQREAAVLELRKRAADVANQAFMMADPARLAALSADAGVQE